MAPLVVQRLPTLIRGMVLLCPFVPPVEPILIKQAEQVVRDLEALPAPTRLLLRLAPLGLRNPVASQRALLTRIRASTTPTVRVGMRKAPRFGSANLLALDASTVFNDVDCPALLIRRHKTCNVTPAMSNKGEACCAGR